MLVKARPSCWLMNYKQAYCLWMNVVGDGAQCKVGLLL